MAVTASCPNAGAQEIMLAKVSHLLYGRMDSIASDCLVDLDMPVQDKLSDLVHLCLGIKQQQQNKLSFGPSQACCMH